MFICVGPNDDERFQIGQGETVNEAVNNWGSGSMPIAIEFEQYKPAIYKVYGPALEVTATVTYTIKDE